MARKLSSLVVGFTLSLLAFSLEALAASAEGSVGIVSNRPDILSVSPNPDGKTWQCQRLGLGEAILTVSFQAQGPDGPVAIHQNVSFEFFDGTTPPAHFGVAIDALEFAAPLASAYDASASPQES